MRSDSRNSVRSRADTGTSSKKLVRSLLVVPLRLFAPRSSIASRKPNGWFSEPLKKKCSNKWAKPVLPRFSLREPTWYHRFTPTIGTL